MERDTIIRDLLLKFPELKGSIFEELLEIMESDIDTAFLSELSPFDEEMDLEKIGQLNKFEIACKYLANQCGFLEKELITKLVSCKNTADQSKLKAMIFKCRSKFELATDLSWNNIKRRLEEFKYGLGVRRGGQIVRLKKDALDNLRYYKEGLKIEVHVTPDQKLF